MNVLFVCWGNTCRSPFAAGVAEQHARVDARSAGLFASHQSPAPPDAIAVAREFGVDLSAHRSAPLTDKALDWAELTVAMEPWMAAELGQRGRPAGALDVPDPIDGGPAAYRTAYRAIDEAVRELLAETQG